MSALVEHRSSPDDLARDDYGQDDYGQDQYAPEDHAPEDHAPDGYAPDGYDDSGSMYEHAEVEQDGPVPTQAQLRIDFGAHLEANYQRLVAQLYAITLDPGEAHDVVQEAYSRAWRNWAVISSAPDPAAWVRHVAVRSTIRSWRRVLSKFGIGRPRRVGDGVDPRTSSMLEALGRLSPGERRCAVLFHMAGASVGEIAAVEQVSAVIVEARLSKARHVVTEGLADVLPAVLGIAVEEPYDEHLYDDEGDFR